MTLPRSFLPDVCWILSLLSSSFFCTFIHLRRPELKSLLQKEKRRIEREIFLNVSFFLWNTIIYSLSILLLPSNLLSLCECVVGGEYPRGIADARRGCWIKRGNQLARKSNWKGGNAGLKHCKRWCECWLLHFINHYMELISPFIFLKGNYRREENLFPIWNCVLKWNP